MDVATNHFPTRTNSNSFPKPEMIHHDQRPAIEIDLGLKRPSRNDQPFMENVFPDTKIGQLLNGLVRSFLIKQEPRLGWARKYACDESALLNHPCEVVAAHQWGVGWLITTIASLDQFKSELPNFDLNAARAMAECHDLPELVTGDITPADGVSVEEKHELEKEAMNSILSCYPSETAKVLNEAYTRYEERKCQESKFVKDCDKLDFIITAFMLERQGFSGFEEFYTNTLEGGFFTEIARDIANVLENSRTKLAKKSRLNHKLE